MEPVATSQMVRLHILDNAAQPVDEFLSLNNPSGETLNELLKLYEATEKHDALMRAVAGEFCTYADNFDRLYQRPPEENFIKGIEFKDPWDLLKRLPTEQLWMKYQKNAYLKDLSKLFSLMDQTWKDRKAYSDK